MRKTKCIAGMAAFLLCWISVSLYAAEPARLPFYEVRQGEVRFYLLGTMHVGKEEPLRQEITQALSRSADLIMEVTADAIMGEIAEEGSELPTLAELMTCKDACLRRQLSPAAFAQLEATLPGMGGQGLENTPAWMISTLLALLDMANLGFSPQFGTELKLMEIWKNRPTRGLEKPEEQIRALSSLDDGVQREMLESYLAMPAEKRMAMYQTLYQIWQSGDAEALHDWYQKMNKDEGISPNTIQKFDEAIVFSRNKRFVDRLLPLLSPRKPVFVAVGALHLGGDQGMLSILSKKGFEITAR